MRLLETTVAHIRQFLENSSFLRRYIAVLLRYIAVLLRYIAVFYCVISPYYWVIIAVLLRYVAVLFIALCRRKKMPGYLGIGEYEPQGTRPREASQVWQTFIPLCENRLNTGRRNSNRSSNFETSRRAQRPETRDVCWALPLLLHKWASKFQSPCKSAPIVTILSWPFKSKTPNKIPVGTWALLHVKLPLGIIVPTFRSKQGTVSYRRNPALPYSQ